jgi:hypothetical protein
MQTDITLNEGDGTWVIVDANVVKATASDLMVDSPGRRTAAALTAGPWHNPRPAPCMLAGSPAAGLAATPSHGSKRRDR